LAALTRASVVATTTRNGVDERAASAVDGSLEAVLDVVVAARCHAVILDAARARALGARAARASHTPAAVTAAVHVLFVAVL